MEGNGEFLRELQVLRPLARPRIRETLQSIWQLYFGARRDGVKYIRIPPFSVWFDEDIADCAHFAVRAELNATNSGPRDVTVARELNTLISVQKVILDEREHFQRIATAERTDVIAWRLKARCLGFSFRNGCNDTCKNPDFTRSGVDGRCSNAHDMAWATRRNPSKR